MSAFSKSKAMFSARTRSALRRATPETSAFRSTGRRASAPAPFDPLERQYLGRQARRPGRSGGKFIKTLDTLPVRRGIPGRLGKGQHADDRIAQPMRRVGDEHVACPHGLVDLTEERIQARDALCIAASGGIAKLTTIKFTLLAPFLFMLISFAAFQSGQNLMDLVTLFSIGLIGIPLRRFDSSRPAFPIGCVQAESA